MYKFGNSYVDIYLKKVLPQAERNICHYFKYFVIYNCDFYVWLYRF